MTAASERAEVRLGEGLDCRGSHAVTDSAITASAMFSLLVPAYAHKYCDNPLYIKALSFLLVVRR
ncbi:hypothetical protein [Candidatus Poriferisodalis sp.]|uniref:hypothetical protein n=1 Tax=Candidatus Poriferisodalis sp. TaxID=3101277 RepID=UPI003B025540